MKFGCAWYPEHWSESRWAEDLELMRAAHMNVVRVAEFAWSTLEPEEGRFELDWLERAIDAAEAHDFDVVIGTPTAAPPAWLTRRYPETLAVRDHGRRDGHGQRCQFSPASKRYLELCERISDELARRFGRRARLIAWQIDNEYNSVSYDEESRGAFQAFLRAKYGSLEALNQRWSTAYWSQTYTDFAEIPLPVGNHNPGLLLEFRRFVSATYAAYQRVQIEAIRRHSDRPITHNFMGWFDAFDHHEVSRDLDFASWDSYVGSGHLDAPRNASAHDLTRGFLRRNFWLMETQPGHVNWAGVNNALNRGELKALAWSAIGHGADAVLYWQWRMAMNGQEQYHGSLLAPDGRPRPVFAEIGELGAELAKAAAVLDGTHVAADVAVLETYADRWALGFQRHHRDFDPVAHLLGYYRPLARVSPATDIVEPSAPLTGYRLVVAPHLHILEPELAARLEDFVRSGGHLVLGPRSGMKDQDSSLLPLRQPGPLAAALGAHVEEYYALDVSAPLAGGAGEASIWAEWLEVDAPDVEVLARYGEFNGWLDGRAAVVTRALGKGRISYVGAWLDEATMTSLMRRFAEESGIDTRQAALPDGVELCARRGARGEVLIAINHTRAPAEIRLAEPRYEVLAQREHGGVLQLEPYGVAVLADTLG